MTTQVGPVVGSARGAEAPSALEGDLAVILDENRSAYLSLGPVEAVFSVKAPMVFAFGESIDTRWAGMTPRERAEAVVSWIRRAAEYCRRPHRRYALEAEPEEGKEEDE